MEIGVITAPAPEWREPLSELLGHKGSRWLPQITQALDQPLDDLRTRFYVGLVDDRIACSAMIASSRAVGILGHVYTQPRDRRKGAIRELLAAALNHCCREGCQWLTLSSEFGSPAFAIYETIGFHGVAPGRGEMIWSAENSVDPFACDRPKVRAARWKDWPGWNLLALQSARSRESLLRSPLLHLKGQGSVEQSFIELQMRRQADKIQALTLVGDHGFALGWALLAQPDGGGKRQFEMYVHSYHAAHGARLIASLDAPYALDAADAFSSSAEMSGKAVECRFA